MKIEHRTIHERAHGNRSRMVEASDTVNEASSRTAQLTPIVRLSPKGKCSIARALMAVLMPTTMPNPMGEGR